MIQIRLLILIYYRIVVGHVRIRFITLLILLANLDLRLQFLSQLVYDLLLILVRQQRLLAIAI